MTSLFFSEEKVKKVNDVNADLNNIIFTDAEKQAFLEDLFSQVEIKDTNKVIILERIVYTIPGIAGEKIMFVPLDPGGYSGFTSLTRQQVDDAGTTAILPQVEFQ